MITKKSFYAGPAFTAELDVEASCQLNEGFSAVYAIRHGGRCCGFALKHRQPGSDRDQYLATSVVTAGDDGKKIPDSPIGTYPTLRQAGIAVLKQAGVVK